MRRPPADDLSDHEPLKHLHQCPWCNTDHVCEEVCTTDLDEELFVERGSHAVCSDPWCVEQAESQKALDILAAEPRDPFAGGSFGQHMFNVQNTQRYITPAWQRRR